MQNWANWADMTLREYPTPIANMPNPASVYCEANGGKLELRQDAAGAVAGICVFPNGSECEEWAYYRGECQPAVATATTDPVLAPTVEITPITESEFAEDGCRIYRNAELGYSFHYLADARIEKNDDPLGGISVLGPIKDGESWPFFRISHPKDREEYKPPEDANLLAWLTDHNMLGEVRVADAQIAGTTAIYERHERSPQSYAYDRYYFANQDSFMCS
jgi:putative hemolysin